MPPSMLPNTSKISRMASDGTVNGQSMQPLYENVACLIMPMNHTTAIEQKISLGRAFNIHYQVGQDVSPGDQITSNGQIYDVKAVRSYSVPFVNHVLCLTEQEVN